MRVFASWRLNNNPPFVTRSLLTSPAVPNKLSVKTSRIHAEFDVLHLRARLHWRGGLITFNVQIEAFEPPCAECLLPHQEETAKTWRVLACQSGVPEGSVPGLALKEGDATPHVCQDTRVCPAWPCMVHVYLDSSTFAAHACVRSYLLGMDGLVCANSFRLFHFAKDDSSSKGARIGRAQLPGGSSGLQLPPPPHLLYLASTSCPVRVAEYLPCY